MTMVSNENDKINLRQSLHNNQMTDITKIRTI